MLRIAGGTDDVALRALKFVLGARFGGQIRPTAARLKQPQGPDYLICLAFANLPAGYDLASRGGEFVCSIAIKRDRCHSGVLFRAPGLVIGALAFGAAGG